MENIILYALSSILALLGISLFLNEKKKQAEDTLKLEQQKAAFKEELEKNTQALLAEVVKRETLPEVKKDASLEENNDHFNK